MTDETNKILSDEEIKDKILSLDIAKECYAYYYKILYDKYLQLLKCHQSEAAEIASLQADIEELNILSRCNSEVYDTRIKELETLNYKQSQQSDSLNPTPTSEGMLLTDEVERYSRTFTNKYSGKGLTPSEVMELHKSEYWEGIYSLMTAKVSASFSKQLVDTGEIIERMIEIVISQYERSEKAEVKVKGLEASNKCLRDCYNKQTTALSEAKAEATKGIGDKLKGIVAHTRLELAKAVREIDTKRVSCYGYIEEITCTELKETVLKLLEGK